MTYLPPDRAFSDGSHMCPFATPTATIIHVILGGADKELEFDELARELKSAKADIALLPGTAHAKLAKSLKRHDVAHQNVATLKKAVQALASRASKGDVILLSPACASFGLFKSRTWCPFATPTATVHTTMLSFSFSP